MRPYRGEDEVGKDDVDNKQEANKSSHGESRDFYECHRS